MKEVKSINEDTYKVSNDIKVCGDCDFCPNSCETGVLIVGSRIEVGA